MIWEGKGATGNAFQRLTLTLEVRGMESVLPACNPSSWEVTAEQVLKASLFESATRTTFKKLSLKFTMQNPLAAPCLGEAHSLPSGGVFTLLCKLLLETACRCTEFFL